MSILRAAGDVFKHFRLMHMYNYVLISVDHVSSNISDALYNYPLRSSVISNYTTARVKQTYPRSEQKGNRETALRR